MIPFTREEFFEAFHRYNEGVWPAQIVLVALALAALVALVRNTDRSSSVAAAILVSLWTWMAVAYHWMIFSDVTPAAWGFGVLFAAQAVLLGRAAANGDLRFGLGRAPAAWVGVVLLAYALLVYPMLGQLGDHPYPHSPSFGLPCPTTIFTFGLLLLTTERVPRHLFVIPLLWAAIGSTAALFFGVWEDVGLGVAAIAAAVSTALRDRA